MLKFLAALFFLGMTLPATAQTGPGMNFAPALPHSFTATITPGYNLTYNGTTQFLAVTGGISGYASGSITLSWLTSISCESQINYGPTAAYGSSVTSAILETTHTLTMTSLPTDGSTIHYQIVCPSSTGILGQTGDMSVSTQGPTTLVSLAYAGGHISMTNETPTVPTNYALANVPADAIYNGELNGTGTENSCYWGFTASADGTVANFTQCAFDMMGRFPSLAYILQAAFRASGTNPPALVVSPPTWQADVQLRYSQLTTQWPNLSAFFSVNTINEPFTGSGNPPTGPPLTGGPWLTAGGNSWWIYPFAYATTTPAVASTAALGFHQYGLEYTVNWGGDPAVNWGGQNGVTNPILQAGNKISFDYIIENVQQALLAGTRIDSVDLEGHIWAQYMYSSNDMKYRLWDIRRLGMVPKLAEGNTNTTLGVYSGHSGFGSIGAFAPGIQVNDSTLARQVAANAFNIFLYDMIRYGGVKDFNFWTNGGPPAGTTVMGPWLSNIKTPVYSQTTQLLQDVALPVSIPVVRRLGYYTSLPFAGTTSQVPSGTFGTQGYGCNYTNGCSGNFGTPGLITIPWTEYVYGSGGVPNTITTFSQTAWTFDIQFYSLGSTGGNIFKAVDASNNQLVLVNWNAASGNITVTIGAASPVVVGTITQNSYNALAVTKNGTTFTVCLNGGTVFTTTATIASIANLQWLDNTGSGNLAQQANLTTIDVYESQSIVTDTAAIRALSTFQNSQTYSYPQILNWTVP